VNTSLRAAALTMVALALCLAGESPARAQGLSSEQQRIRDRMDGVERRLLELIETTEQPERADRLRRALTLSRDTLLVSRMRDIASLLAEGRYSEAREAETDVLADLQLLADALNEGQGADRLARLRRAADEVGALLRRQTAAAERTPGLTPSNQEQLDRAADLQQGIRSDTDKLRAALGPSPGGEELALAMPFMDGAEEALRQAQTRQAEAQQLRARERLQAAGAALRRAIRRAEAERRAEARRNMGEVLRRMLEEQRDVSADTAETAERTAAVPAGRAPMLRLADLAERERALARRSRQAAELLEAFGRTVAWPEAMARLEEDLLACAGLLEAGRIGPARALQSDIENMLETLARVLARASEPAERPPEQEPQDRQQGRRDRPPVNLAEELKVVRALQSALNRRTARLHERRGAMEAQEVRSGLDRLAERQAALRKALGQLEQLAAGGEAE